MSPARPERAPGRLLVVALAAAFLGSSALAARQSAREGEAGFRFRSGIELINVTATVTDRNGRFVAGLDRDDFLVYEDGALQNVTHFSAERVPVSLGIAIDTSGSMAGEKMIAAREALDRFLYELLDPADEVFLLRFSADPSLVQDWTTDREAVSRAVRRLRTGGATALYDAVAEAVPMAQAGGIHQKKAVLIISDGHDTSSRTDLAAVRQLVRETEVLVYAIGIDGRGPSRVAPGRMPRPVPLPVPWPGRRIPWPQPQPRGPASGVDGDRVNAAALRELTDDSGGRTEIVRQPRDLHPATAGIADELSRQYYLGYPSPGHADGRWHSIRVEVREASHRVRARRGYVATPH